MNLSNKDVIMSQITKWPVCIWGICDKDVHNYKKQTHKYMLYSKLGLHLTIIFILN